MKCRDTKKKITLLAPAKVNYRLDVLRKRADNYHDLRMVMQRIALADEIELSLSETPGIRVRCNREEVPDGPGNIVWRAADALLKRAGLETGIDIFLVKNIPMAAGLGGGSSDAASVLMGLNELLGLDFTDEQLMEIGVRLGADVPFFIFKKTALAEGIGDRLSAIEGLPPAWLVLVNPNIHVSTAWVYQNLQLTKKTDTDKLPEFCNRIEDICSLLSNDLEQVTIGRFPVIREIKEQLRANGARGVLMSGSGPTVFGVFATERQARDCRKLVSRNTSWYSVVTHTL
ncbi:MAG TPA: 4-(cytidine 5'-diphospho)-2-C-methyl-D-erythritol kinase [Geobacteraceae bacterium]|nr:4-(cytidine 5'-diphospho)-2-C-methyl-D-erythritol kinase [Geobacteraceae bacterium]